MLQSYSFSVKISFGLVTMTKGVGALQSNQLPTPGTVDTIEGYLPNYYLCFSNALWVTPEARHSSFRDRNLSSPLSKVRLITQSPLSTYARFSLNWILIVVCLFQREWYILLQMAEHAEKLHVWVLPGGTVQSSYLTPGSGITPEVLEIACAILRWNHGWLCVSQILEDYTFCI